MAEMAVRAPGVQELPVSQVKKEPYIGSVRFFKHIFLGILIAMIVVPTTLSVVLALRLSSMKATEAELRAQLDAALAQVQQVPPSVTLPAATPDPEVAAPATPPAVETPAYTELYPDFYAPPVEFSSIATEMTCYLTFDDGPSSRTDQVLDILDETQVKATFFVTLQEGEANRARLLRAAQAGHTIGLHTASHKYGTIYASVDAFLADYYELYSWVKEVTGQAPTVFRFPGGSINGYNRHIYQEIIAEMTRRGFVYFDWNVSSGDAASAQPLPAAQLQDNCLRDLVKFNRAIVLMHDSEGKSTTVEALPEIIAGAKEKGYTLSALTSEVKPVIFGYQS